MSQVRYVEISDPKEPQSQVDQSPTSPCPVFPQETFDHIIDHLHHDLESLRRCSLVCRNWAASTAYHLFYYCHYLHWPLSRHARFPVTIRSKRNFALDCPPYDVDDGPATLQVVLSSTRPPRFYINICSLHVDFPPKHPYRRLPETNAPIGIWTTVPELLALVDSLPRLRFLELSSVQLRTHDPRFDTSTIAASHTPRSLSALTISPAMRRDFSQGDIIAFTHFFRHFARICTLRLRGLLPINRSGLEASELPTSGRVGSAADYSSPVEVQKLVFDLCSPDAISTTLYSLKWRLNISALETLELVVSKDCRYHHAANTCLTTALPAFLRLATNLKVLTCEPYFYPGLHDFAPPTLTELHLRGENIISAGRSSAVPGPHPSELQWSAIFDMPVTLFTPHLRAIYIDFCFVHYLEPSWPFPFVTPSATPSESIDIFATELSRTLEACDWIPLACIAQSVEECTLRLQFTLNAKQGVEREQARQRCIGAIEEIARRRIPENVREIVRLEVVSK